MGVSAARASIKPTTSITSTLRWQRPRLPAHAPQRHGGGVLAVLDNRRILNLSGGNPADYDGGADYVGGSLLALRASWHHLPSCSLRPNTPLLTAVYRNPAYIHLPRTLSAGPEWWCRAACSSFGTRPRGGGAR